MELAGACISERRKARSGTKMAAQKVRHGTVGSESREQEEQRLAEQKDPRGKKRKGEQGLVMDKGWVQDGVTIQQVGRQRKLPAQLVAARSQLRVNGLTQDPPRTVKCSEVASFSR